MSRRSLRWLALGTVLAAVLGAGATTAFADPADPPADRPTEPGLPSVAPLGAKTATDLSSDELPNPLEADRRELRDQALRDVIAGKRKVASRAGSKVVRLGAPPAPLTETGLSPDRRHPAGTVEQYVEVSRQRTDRVFVLLVEFGDDREPSYPDTDTDADIPGPRLFDGPAHNTTPRPDRRRDNVTLWRPDFNREYYQNLYFGSGEQSVKSYYERQSSGRYSIDGDVSDWVKVRYNQARYGRSNGYPCAQNVCGNSWLLVRDALDAWVAQQRTRGRTDAEIKATLDSYDVWDRYDHDRDGNFNEPDGYLDRLQLVHAGGDQSEGDQAFGEDAIWSHRWYAFGGGQAGPGPAGNQRGGTQVGDTGVWAGDYTMQAENVGMSVFAHEYGHDLGLPDHYDTADAGDNSVNWWSLMGQSRLSARGDVGVGTRAADLSAWDKFTLGWLNYTVAAAGERTKVELGPHEYNSAKPQALIVTLPTTLVEPATGARQWWSGARNNYASGLARVLSVPAAKRVSLGFQANYNIEDCGATQCDAAYVEVDEGNGYRTIPGTITSGSGNGIAGYSNGWRPAQFDLSAYAGKTIALRFRYATNAATQGARPDAPAGLFLDDIVLRADDTTVLADGAENGAGGWAVFDFRNVGDEDVPSRYYLASYRAELSYDRYLETGPYHFGWPGTRPRQVEHFPYQYGLLVSYWDTSYADNNTSQHPGHGLVLPIDAHPRLLRTRSGDPWRGRIQTYDAPFSLRDADSMVLHNAGRPSLIRGARAQPLFDDTGRYWNSEQPMVGVLTPRSGVTLRVTEQRRSTMTVQLGVSRRAPRADR